MDTDLQDDFFSDADLDDLPANTLNELEQRAIASTQRLAHGVNDDITTERRPANCYGDATEHYQEPKPQNLALGVNQLEAPSPAYDYDFEDDTVIDLDGPYAIDTVQNNIVNLQYQQQQQQQHRRLNGYGSAAKAVARELREHQSRTKFRPPLSAASHSTHQLHDGRTDTNAIHPAQPALDSTLDVVALQARIQELEVEQQKLRRVAEDANSTAHSKAGEIAIVRTNHEKTAKEYERKVTSLQQLHAEETAKQKSELERMKKEIETMETEKRFLEHDMIQQGERVKAAKKTIKDGQGLVTRRQDSAQDSPTTTPSKRRHLPFRDGFDDDEVIMMSPSKPKERGRPGTPRAGTKRKRIPSVHSPGTPTLFDEFENNGAGATPPGPVAAEPTVFVPASDSRTEILQFVRRLINHRAEPGGSRTLEVLTHFSFPSAVDNTLAALVYDSIAQLSLESNVEASRMNFCKTLLSLWERCLVEKYYSPLYGLVDMLQDTIMVSPEVFSGKLIPQLVPLCSKTIDLVALRVAKAFTNPSTESRPSEQLMQDVYPLDYLNLLHLTALNASLFGDDIAEFWSNLTVDFVILWLSRSQPMAQMTLTLQLLATAILPDSFGPRISEYATSNAPQQHKNESSLINRLLNLFFEIPAVPPDEELYTASELLQLRLGVMTLLTQLCSTQHGGRLLATHTLAIGRLVRLLHDSILAMYAYREATHALTVSLVNGSVMLLAHLTSTYRDVVDLHSKLAAVPSGVHKHLVALSRVAFNEGISILEIGISPEAKEAAHHMLDEHLSLEEGDAVVELFPSAE